MDCSDRFRRKARSHEVLRIEPQQLTVIVAVLQGSPERFPTDRMVAFFSRYLFLSCRKLPIFPD